MKRTRWWWAVGLVGAGMVAGAALALAARGGMALADRSIGNDVADGPNGAELIAGAVRDPHACDDDCRRSRGAAALMVLSQRPAP